MLKFQTAHKIVFLLLALYIFYPIFALALPK